MLSQLDGRRCDIACTVCRKRKIRCRGGSSSSQILCLTCIKRKEANSCRYESATMQKFKAFAFISSLPESSSTILPSPSPFSATSFSPPSSAISLSSSSPSTASLSSSSITQIGKQTMHQATNLKILEQEEIVWNNLQDGSYLCDGTDALSQCSQSATLGSNSAAPSSDEANDPNRNRPGLSHHTSDTDPTHLWSLPPSTHLSHRETSQVAYADARESNRKRKNPFEMPPLSQPINSSLASVPLASAPLTSASLISTPLDPLSRHPNVDEREEDSFNSVKDCMPTLGKAQDMLFPLAAFSKSDGFDDGSVGFNDQVDSSQASPLPAGALLADEWPIIAPINTSNISEAGSCNQPLLTTAVDLHSSLLLADETLPCAPTTAADTAIFDFHKSPLSDNINPLLLLSATKTTENHAPLAD